MIFSNIKVFIFKIWVIIDAQTFILQREVNYATIQIRHMKNKICSMYFKS